MTVTAAPEHAGVEPGTDPVHVVVGGPRPASGARLTACVDPARSTLGLAAIGALLVLLHTLVQVTHYRWMEVPWVVRGLLDLDQERSLGTWYAAFLLLAASATSLACARASRRTGAGARPWQVLGVGFLALSIDEVASVHERFNGLLEFSWTLPAAAIALAVGASLVPFLRRLPTRTASHLVLAGAVYLSGALGVELATEPMLHAGQLDTLAYNLTTAAEEGLEMAGVVLYLHTVLRYLDPAPRSS